MSNPLRWFRKYQNMMMWVFGVLMVIAFVFLGGMGSGVDMSDSVRPGLGGRSDGDVVAEWQGGKLNEGDFDNLRQARNMMVTFTQSALNVTSQRGGSRGRVNTVPMNDSDGALLEMVVLAQQAEDMGMVVDDQACLNYLTQLTDGRIEPSEFRNLWNNITGGRSNDKELLNMLRRELMAIQVRAMMQSGGYPVSPIRHWEYYNRLERQVSAEAIQLPVSNFIAEVGEPSNSELRAYFDKYKTQYNEPLTPEPGFKQRAKAGFHYIKFDFNEYYEAELAAITDEEIAEYYEKNKSEFRELSFKEDDLIPTAPDTGEAPPAPSTEETPEEKTTEETTESKPTTETKPATETTEPATETVEPAATDEAAVVPNENPIRPETVIEEGEPTGVPEVPSVPATTDGAAVPAPSPTPQPAVLLAQASDAAAAADAVAGAVETATDAVEGVVEGAAETVKGNVEATVDAAKETVAPVTETTTESTEAAAATVTESTAEKAPVESKTEKSDSTDDGEDKEEDGEETKEDSDTAKFKPLEKVAPEIKRALANPRAQKKLETALATARARCERYYREQVKYQVQLERGREATEPSLPDLSEVPSPTPLDIKGIPLCDEVQIGEYDLGQAYDLEISRNGFAKVEFAKTGFDDNIPLFKTNEFPNSRKAAGGVSSAPIRYIFWKTEAVPEKAPEFEEVREQVLAAWKKEQAYNLAVAAAEKIAQDSSGGLPDNVAGAGPKIEIKDVTWMSGGNVPLDDSTTPSPSLIEGVGQAGYEFYAKLFSLGEGEVGVAHDQPQNNVYVVRVTNQGPELPVRQAGFFANAVKIPGINYIVRRENQRALFNNYQDLLDSEGVTWNRQPRDSSSGR